MTDEEELYAADLIGKRLLRVTTAWHHYAADEPSLLHLWLHLEGLGPVHFHTPSTGPTNSTWALSRPTCTRT
ncbi:hypothetical protein [Streptomyces olivochromogenes]|uniref:hypothetical protein n=1 Tax=Streptomyces olivochromogenes TaxID=1963 RepID=UPI0036C783F1